MKIRDAFHDTPLRSARAQSRPGNGRVSDDGDDRAGHSTSARVGQIYWDGIYGGLLNVRWRC